MEIISRVQAAAAGLKYYFTGVACKNGHVVPRYVSVCQCVTCGYIWTKERRARAAAKKEAAKNKKKSKSKPYVGTEDKRNYHREYYQKNKETLAARQVEYSAKNATFKSYGKKLLPIDNPSEAENGDLLVSCYYCKASITPTRHQATKRLEVIRGKYPIGEEHNFYCSDECKSNCRTYRSSSTGTVQLFDYSLLSRWADDVKKLAGNTCEICGSTDNLHAHHVEPKSTNPAMAYDIENGMCLCSDCHHKRGHAGDCSPTRLGEIACRESFPKTSPHQQESAL